MTLNLVHVRRGDLFTADAMNALIDAALSLDARLSALETGGATPVLSDWSPAGDFPVLSQLTLIGDKFLTPSDQNTVTMDGTFPIQQFLGGSDGQHLVIQVPNVFANLPRLIPVKVTNKNGTSNQLQIRITPQVPVQDGVVVIFPQTPALGTINVGSKYTLQWLVDSQTLLPETYVPQVVFTNVQGASPAAWQSNTVVSPTGSLTITPGKPLTVTAQITIPAGAVSATVALKATSLDGKIYNGSDTLPLVIGQAPVVSDPRVLLTIDDIPPNDPHTNQPNKVQKVLINNVVGIQIPFGASGSIPIKVQVTNDATAAGVFAFSAATAAGTPAGLWGAATPAPAQAGIAALGSRILQVTIANTDPANSTAVASLQVNAAHSPSGQATTDFTSFIRFPIQGYVAS